MPSHQVHPQHADLIQQGLEQAFNVTQWHSIEPLTRGLSGASVYKLTVNEATLIAKIDDPSSPYNDLAREYRAQQIAAERRVAPRVYYADSDKGILLMDFIAAQPVSDSLRHNTAMVEKFAALIQTLHSAFMW